MCIRPAHLAWLFFGIGMGLLLSLLLKGWFLRLLFAAILIVAAILIFRD